MGLMDRLNGAKRRLWSPMQVWMAEHRLRPPGAGRRRGEARRRRPRRGRRDARAHRGLPADDRLGQRPQGQVAARRGARPTLGTPRARRDAAHRVWRRRAPSTPSTRSTPSCTAARAWARPPRRSWTSSAVPRISIGPTGQRSGQDGPDDVRVTIELDAPTVSVGSRADRPRDGARDPRHRRGRDRSRVRADARHARAGRRQVAAAAAGEVQAGGRARARRQARALRAGEPLQLPFSVDVPDGVPPTLHNGGQTSVVWQVRASRGKSAGWALVGVLDPQAAAGTRNQPSQGLLSFLASLDSPR